MSNFVTARELSDLVSDDEKQVSFKAWVWQIRKQGKIVFLELWDGTTWKTTPVIFKSSVISESAFSKLQLVYRGASVIVEGSLVSDERAPNGFEIRGSNFEIIHPSDEKYDMLLPEGAGVDVKLSKRHIAIRSPKATAILTFRSMVLKYIREFYYSYGAHEVTPPTIVAAQAEGGSELFEIKYFEKKAYLTQSSQLYLEAAMFSLRDVFSILSSYRAEKSRTRRHLTEYTHIEGEHAFMGFQELLSLIEDLIIFVITQVKKNHEDILKLFNRKLEIPKKPFPRVKYTDALEIIRKKNHKISYGDDITDSLERELVDHFGVPIILIHFPVEMKPFYHKINPEDPKFTNSADFIFPNIGEVVGAGERETDLTSMKERMRKMDPPVDEKDYDWYLDLRRYGSVKHSGFGLGLERILVWLLDLEHIRDACLFPRFQNRISP